MDDVTEESAHGDDWLDYKIRALSILREGLAMPVVSGRYEPPRGFLYNYFVAAIFAVFGENSAWVYLVQAAMLGVAIAVMYLAFRRQLPPGGGILYLVILLLSSTLDVFWKYTVRLLSENLALFWLAFFFLTLLRTLEASSIRWALATGLCLGFVCLTRPHLVFLGPAVAICLAMTTSSTRRGSAMVVALCGPLALLVSLMALRDYAMTGRFTFSPITVTAGWALPCGPIGLPSPSGLVAVTKDCLEGYAIRALYCLGFLFTLQAKYPLMPHWIVMWTGVGAFILERSRERRLDPWQGAVLLYIGLSLAPPIAVADVSNYGVRMMLPAVPAAWVLAVHWTSAWLGKSLARSQVVPPVG